MVYIYINLYINKKCQLNFGTYFQNLDILLVVRKLKSGAPSVKFKKQRNKNKR